MPVGGRIRLVAHGLDDHVVVEVRDSGLGMPPDVQERLFEPFFTTKGERGTGLGLVQVLTIVHQFGGELRVQSTPGEGTTFRLQFPRAVSESVQSSTIVPENAPRTQLSVLAVDDDERLANLVATTLRHQGHTVQTATSGETALKLLENSAYDLVISDLGMGAGMNGWQLADQVRQRWPATRVVIASGWGASITQEDMVSHGVEAVLAKPYRLAELRTVADSLRPGSPDTSSLS